LYERGSWTGVTPSHTDLAAVLSRFPDLPDWIREHNAGPILRVGRFTPLAFVTYMGQRLDQALAASWWSGLGTGADLSDTSPVYQLRERLLSYRAAAKTSSVRGDHIVQQVIKAWNYHVAGRDMSRLRLRVDETRPVFDPPIPGLKNPAPERRIPDKAGT
jgi:hypothetical protein